MENASKLLMMSFSVILFLAAMAVVIMMYYQNINFLREIEEYKSFRVTMDGE